QELREATRPVAEHGALPREMVETHVIQTHPVGLYAEPARELPLEPDRDVAQTDRAVTAVEQRLGHQARRIREVDEPGPRRRSLGRELRELEDDRDRSER